MSNIRFRAMLIAAALVAMSAAFAVVRMLRTREASVTLPSAAEDTAGVQAVEAMPSGETPAGTPVEPAEPTYTESTDVVNGAPSPVDPALRPMREAFEASYASTTAAFALHGEKADYDTHDAQAKQDAEKLQELFVSMQAELSPELVSACEALIERIDAAQLQLMAFAINRKNRGLPDSAQVEAELADRKAFQKDSAPLFKRIRAELGSEA